MTRKSNTEAENKYEFVTQFIYSRPGSIRKLRETFPQATVSRWNFYHPIAARICLPQWYENKFHTAPEKSNDSDLRVTASFKK